MKFFFYFAFAAILTLEARSDIQKELVYIFDHSDFTELSAYKVINDRCDHWVNPEGTEIVVRKIELDHVDDGGVVISIHRVSDREALTRKLSRMKLAKHFEDVKVGDSIGGKAGKNDIVFCVNDLLINVVTQNKVRPSFFSPPKHKLGADAERNLRSFASKFGRTPKFDPVELSKKIHQDVKENSFEADLLTIKKMQFQKAEVSYRVGSRGVGIDLELENGAPGKVFLEAFSSDRSLTFEYGEKDISVLARRSSKEGNASIITVIAFNEALQAAQAAKTLMIGKNYYDKDILIQRSDEQLPDVKKSVLSDKVTDRISEEIRKKLQQGMDKTKIREFAERRLKEEREKK